jgi:two-component system, OmpR family, sensor histidine kinase KdpD
VAQWVALHKQPAGLGTKQFSNCTSRLVPMLGSQQIVGVLGVCPQDPECFTDSEQQRMLDTCASLIALSIERDQSFLAAHEAHVLVEAEQLRNYLLSTVSHDLRTPLATIAVTTSSLLEESNEQSWPEKREMLHTVVDEAHRLSRQVENLLGHARLTSGAIVLNREWQVLEELVGIALTRLQRELEGREVRVNIDTDFPLLWVAGDLIERVLVNLLENAIRYTPPGTDLEITAVLRSDHQVDIRIADNGPGLPPENNLKLFDKFFRGTTIADGQRGIGLGLAICKAIVEAHEGTISAANRPAGGAEFTISLPCPQRSPQATLDDAHSPSA